MTTLLPLHDGDHAVQFDDDVAAWLAGFELRLLAGRVVAMRENQFIDLQNLIAGDGAFTRDGDPHDLRRRNLGTLHYDFGGHGELVPRDAETDAARLAVALAHAGESARPPSPAAPRSPMQTVRLSPGDRLAFVPFEHARDVPNISADATHNAATRLTLSHWPANRTPARYKANLSTESVLRFVAERADDPDVRHMTTDHFDLDGLASVYGLIAPDHALRHQARLVELARFGDFARGRSDAARRLAFALDAVAARTSREIGAPHDESARIARLFRALLPALRDLLDAPSPPEALWRDADRHHAETEALLDHPDAALEQHPALDLAVFRLPAAPALRAGAARRYFGLSPIGFHNRTPLSTLAIVAHGDVVVHQRYEGWVERVSAAPRPRRDLSILARALRAAEPHACRWQYDGVQHIMPRLGHDGAQPSGLPAEAVVDALKRLLAIAPAAWTPTPDAPSERTASGALG
ncbi:DUF6687 family protein [Burkholderia thailandensis]|uniref:DUF6687 family protein n=1 Tax=Burkholderia thailandensis TaxID=57975 RepID=UPI0022ABCDBA|nr:DUF6687 family protein [Burkholderia thailandensis]MCZ2900931.1 hypothetical protein [Burkholderia thailandensis]MDD1480785.1 hypothetical protein [Burkholderia thailandensis]MDD1487668.1 hypothetical protein [Burkholderia thailandensis]MDD1493545.1 hypothetical protein [Burkholderia thailandensis]